MADADCICDARIVDPGTCDQPLCDTYHAVSIVLNLITSVLAVILLHQAISIQRYMGLRLISMRTLCYICGGLGSLCKLLSGILGVAHNRDYVSSSILFDLGNLLLVTGGIFVCYMWTTVTYSHHGRAGIQRRVLNFYKAFVSVTLLFGLIGTILKAWTHGDVRATGSLMYFISTTLALVITVVFLIRFYFRFQGNPNNPSTLAIVARVNLLISFFIVIYIIVLLIFSIPGTIDNDASAYVTRQYVYRVLEFCLFSLVYYSFYLVTQSYKNLPKKSSASANTAGDVAI